MRQHRPVETRGGGEWGGGRGGVNNNNIIIDLDTRDAILSVIDSERLSDF